MVDYFFLIPCSPSAQKDEVRKRLQELCFRQLVKLKSSYVVWLLGDTEVDHPYFKKVSLSAVSKEDRLWEAGKALKDLPQLAKYLVRLDDDDMVNPEVFDALATQDFDIAYDRKHWFFDLSTGLCSRQKRNWIPNTAIHRFELAMQEVESTGGAATPTGKNFLFACDHSQAWHPFYEGKRVINPDSPLYLRILNPGSITATREGKFSEKGYIRYLDGFGEWNAKIPPSLSELKKELDLLQKLVPSIDYKPKKRIFGFRI